MANTQKVQKLKNLRQSSRVSLNFAWIISMEKVQKNISMNLNSTWPIPKLLTILSLFPLDGKGAKKHFDELEFYMANTQAVDDSIIIPARWIEGASTPTFYFLKAGFTQEKC